MSDQQQDPTTYIDGDGIARLPADEFRVLLAEPNRLREVLYAAWTIIANVSEGDWTKQTDEWVKAAERWRDEDFHPSLDQQQAQITDDMLDRALDRMRDEAELPYMARARDYGPATPLWSDEQKAALRAADDDATRRNREFMRAVLAAALFGGGWP